MMRGYRIQLAALFTAIVVFVAALLVRSSQTGPDPVPTLPATPTTSALVIGQAGTAAPEQPLPTQTPQPVQASTDGVPTFREGLIGSVNRLNPLYAPGNAAERDISSLIFEGLIDTNGYGEPVPVLARNWVISSDGLEYTVFLRDDVLWQDGTQFTSVDVLYTMSLLRSPEFSGPEELSAFWRTVETESLGTFVVRFRLAQPLGLFLDRLQIGILPEHALRGIRAGQLESHPFNLSPIGTGPYQLESIHVDETAIREINLRAAPNYAVRSGVTPPAISRVRFSIYPDFDAALADLQAGAIDGLSSVRREQRTPLFLTANDRDLPMYNQLENTLGVLIFNWQSETAPYFRDQRMRVALAAGVDRHAVIDRTLGNAAIPADSPLMPGSWAYLTNLGWPEYNTATSRDLLAQTAARIERLDGEEEEVAPPPDSNLVAPGALPTPTPTATPPPVFTFNFTILVPDDAAITAVAQEIALQWSQLGLSVSVDAQPLDEYFRRLDAGEFDSAIVEFNLGDSGDPDVYAFWNQGQYPDGENYGGVDDRRISILLERARRDPWGINRSEAYHNFQREFVERVVALPLYYPIFSYVTSARVDGLQLGFIGTAADRFRNINEWTLLN